MIGAITSNKIVSFSLRLLKLIVPIKVRQIKQFSAHDDGSSSVMICWCKEGCEVKRCETRVVQLLLVICSLSNKSSKSYEL